MTATATIEERGKTLYEERLREKLEAERLGEAVAIHLESGDYVVNRRWAKAMNELRKLHPAGEVFTRFIGPPTPDEIALATMLRSQDGSAGEKS